MQSLATLLVRRSLAPALLAATGLVVAQLGACTGDEFVSGGNGGGGGGEPTTTSSPASSSSGAGPTTTSSGDVSASASSSSGGCNGCVDPGGACHEEQNLDFCGPVGAECEACPASQEECHVADCDAGACVESVLDDNSPCDGGACLGGVCDETAEDCTNGVDDDDAEDDDVDCDDSECQVASYLCSDPKESEWAGPFLVIESSGAATCPLDLTHLGSHFVDPEGTCDCTVDVDCALSVEVGDVACANSTRVVVTEDCEQQPFGPTDFIAAITPICIASGGPVENPDHGVLTACVLLEGGCNEGEACKPPPTALPVPGDDTYLLCILQEGTHDCPADFPSRRLGWESEEEVCSCNCKIDEDTCDGSLQTSNASNCDGCNASEDPCAVLEVPSDTCSQYLGASASRSIFERDTDLTPDPDVDFRPSFEGPATVTYCCQAYSGG